MKMFLTGIFGILCLGPYAAMGDQYSWIPDQVPRPPQQCINLGLGYAGACVELPRTTLLVRQHYEVRNVCTSLKCAEPRASDGGYNSIAYGRPLDGTICGFLKACHDGNCVDIPPYRIPTLTGAQTFYNCEPESIRPSAIHPTTRPRRRPAHSPRKF